VKDEVPTPVGFDIESFPIARPNELQADRAADLTERLATPHVLLTVDLNDLQA
jgi:hypothetical protein